MTIDDPKSYTAPWTVKLTQPRELDSELLDSPLPREREELGAHGEVILAARCCRSRHSATAVVTDSRLIVIAAMHT